MAGSGNFRDVAVFQRLGLAGSDGYGNVHQTWTDLFTARADVREVPGREVLAGNALEASARATLRFYRSEDALAVTGADRVYVRDAYWNIKSRPSQVGPVPHILECIIERGVAV